MKGAKTGKPEKPTQKPVIWMGDNRRVLRGFPEDVKDDIGAAILAAQKGAKHADAKPMRGFGEASVVEIIEDYDGDTFRLVYTVRFSDAVYVLHAFQKKSKRGIATPKHDIELIKVRLRQAKEISAQQSKDKVAS